MRSIGRTFLAGLVAILPIVITISLLVWIAMLAETFFGRAIQLAIYDKFYYRGMGLLTGVIVIYLLGLMLRAWIIRVGFEWAEGLLQRVPVVKTIYGAVRDLMGFLSASRDQEFNQVVMVTMGATGIRQLGLVTRRDFSACPRGMADEDTLAVYLPMSYQMGGFTTFVPRAWVRPIDMSFEDAMRFALTAGMSVGPRTVEPGPPSPSA